MIKIFGIVIAILFCVIITLLAIGSCWLVADNKRLKKESQKKEEELKQNEHQHKINNEAKESFETGNSSADFDATIDVLSKPYDTEGNLIVTYDVNTDKVSMPLWYWKKIVRYAVDVQGVEEE